MKKFLISMGPIPRSSLRRDSGVGWVERQRYPSFPAVGIGAVRLHPPYNFARSASALVPRSVLRGSSFNLLLAVKPADQPATADC